MEWTKLHGQVLGQAFEQVLSRAECGAVAFVRCLTPDVVKRLAEDANFCVQNWQVRRVADADDANLRTITADRAVEMREAKGDAILLFVDTHLAGAGMDGIYSASREVDEAGLFEEARRLAGAEVTRRSSSAHTANMPSEPSKRRRDSAASTAFRHGRRLIFSAASRRTTGIPAHISTCSACGPLRNLPA